MATPRKARGDGAGETHADGLPILEFPTPAALERWIAKHVEAPGLWLKIAKKGTGVETASYAEALDVALAWGWIDGQKGAFDATYFVQRFTPRRARSPWSERNRTRVLELERLGKMQPRGRAEVEAAKKDGRWATAYAPARTATVPDDLARALAKDAKARAFFEQLDGANRYAILYRLQAVKRPETRAKKLEGFVAMLRAGETIHPRRTARTRRAPA